MCLNAYDKKNKYGEKVKETMDRKISKDRREWRTAVYSSRRISFRQKQAIIFIVTGESEDNRMELQLS